MRSEEVKLTPAQIEEVFAFVRSKNVQYEDVQFEIVDHLSSAVEEIMSENPAKTFKRTLNEVFNKFPITGFALLIQGKTKAVKKYWRKRFWSYLVTYLTLPKILITIGLFLIAFSFFDQMKYVIQYFHFALFLLSLIIWSRKKHTQKLILALFIHVDLAFSEGWFKSKTSSKKFLVYETFLKMTLISFSVIFFFWHVSWFTEAIISSTLKGQLFFSFMFSLSLIISHAIFFVFPSWMEEEFENNYAHLNVKLT